MVVTPYSWFLFQVSTRRLPAKPRPPLSTLRPENARKARWKQSPSIRTADKDGQSRPLSSHRAHTVVRRRPPVSPCDSTAKYDHHPAVYGARHSLGLAATPRVDTASPRGERDTARPVYGSAPAF